MRRLALYLLPLAAFLVLAGFLMRGLSLNPREVPSPLVNQTAPAFTLNRLGQPGPAFTPDELKGQVWMLNVWASWCVACRIEHPLLVRIAQARSVPIVGLNYKDKPDAALGWLAQWGDPYVLSVTDLDGRVGLDYGVYGVPETFVIDTKGTIRFKQIGPITEEVWNKRMLPLIEELRRS